MQFDTYFTVLQNAAQQIDHENRVNKCPVKRIMNFLDITSDKFEELSSPPSVAELSIKLRLSQHLSRMKMHKIQTLFMCHMSCSSSCLHKLRP